jgi:hypothetical protein
MKTRQKPKSLLGLSLNDMKIMFKSELDKVLENITRDIFWDSALTFGWRYCVIRRNLNLDIQCPLNSNEISLEYES